MDPMDEVVIREIVDRPKSMTKAHYMTKYPGFFKRCPVLSEKLFDPNMDKSMLNFLMKQRTKVLHNDLSEHEASVNVGSRLVNKYVKPLVDNKSN